MQLMYLTNVARLDMGSGYAATLLTSAEPVDRVKQRIQWLFDNGYNWWPFGFGRVAELDGWVPDGYVGLGSPTPAAGSRPLPPLDASLGGNVPPPPPPDTQLAPREGLAGHTQLELLSAVEEIEGLLAMGMAVHNTADSWPSGLKPVVVNGKIIRWDAMPA